MVLDLYFLKNAFPLSYQTSEATVQHTRLKPAPRLRFKRHRNVSVQSSGSSLLFKLLGLTLHARPLAVFRSRSRLRKDVWKRRAIALELSHLSASP
jgi:hypothetical protein